MAMLLATRSPWLWLYLLIHREPWSVEKLHRLCCAFLTLFMMWPGVSLQLKHSTPPVDHGPLGSGNQDLTPESFPALFATAQVTVFCSIRTAVGQIRMGLPAPSKGLISVLFQASLELEYLGFPRVGGWMLRGW